MSSKDFPFYFSALSNGTTIIANDANTNEYTFEFTDVYLKPNDIRSMLDVPIRMNGEVCGVLCCEQVGATKEWNDEDIAFARSIADIISLTTELNRTKVAEESALYKSKLLAAITETTQGLLESQKWTTTLLNCFETMGKLIGVSNT